MWRCLGLASISSGPDEVLGVLWRHGISETWGIISGGEEWLEML